MAGTAVVVYLNGQRGTLLRSLGSPHIRPSQEASEFIVEAVELFQKMIGAILVVRNLEFNQVCESRRKIMNITLEFNGKQYTLPSDITEYLEILDITEGVQRGLLDNFLRKSADSYDGIVYPSAMESAFTKAAEKYVRLLCAKGVYTETAEDFIATSDGYRTFSKISEDASQANLRFSNEEKRNYRTRSQAAERNAMSKITGSGVNVYSSSFLTLAMSSAVEYSTLKGQYNKANDQYKRELQYLREKGDNERKRKELSYYKFQYCPAVEKSLQLFSYEMMRAYLATLIDNDLFDKETLKYVDVAHSQKLLRNLEISINKDKILEEAFLNCPFNVNVYIELGKLGKLDEKSLSSAEIFGLANPVKSELETMFSNTTYFGNVRSDLKNVEGCIVSLSQITGHERSYYYKKFTDPIYESIVYQYQSLHKLTETKEKCLEFLQRYSRNIADLTDEKIRSLAIDRVKEMVSDDEYNDVISLGGYFDLTKKICPLGVDLKSKNEIEQYDIELISRNLSSVVQEIMTAVNSKNQAIEKKIKSYQRKREMLIFIMVLGASVFCIAPMVMSSFPDIVFCLILFMGVAALVCFSYLESCKQKMDKLKSDNHIVLAADVQ